MVDMSLRVGIKGHQGELGSELGAEKMKKFSHVLRSKTHKISMQSFVKKFKNENRS